MRHRTTNSVHRAASIADRAAQQCWEETHNSLLQITTWFMVFYQVLKEFAGTRYRKS